MTDRHTSTERETKRILEQWATRLGDELGLDDAAVDIDAILAVAGVAAHAVIRPAAPVTTYLVGYAAGLAQANAHLGRSFTPAAVAAETASATAAALARKYAVAGEGDA